MTITLDTSGGNYTTTGTSLTQSVTLGSGTNGMLSVAVATRVVGDVITGVTWGGVALTRAVYYKHSANDDHAYVYLLPSAASGTANIVVSASASASIGMSFVNHFGVNQSTTPEATGTSETASTSITCSLTTAIGSIIVCSTYNNRDITAGTNTTKMGTPIGDTGGVFTTTPFGSAGSNSVAWSQSDSTRTTNAFISLAEASAFIPRIMMS